VNDWEAVDAEPSAQQLAPPLHPREVDIVEGALSMKTKLAMDIYTPLNHVYAVPDDTTLDKQGITTIYSHGYSRVPVYRRNPQDPEDITAIRGYLVVRKLILIDWEDERALSTLPFKRPTCVSPRIDLISLMRVLQTNGPMMTFVCARPDLANRVLQRREHIPVEAGLLGLITMVDIMESILQDRIYDERDIIDRNKAITTLHRWAATKLQSAYRGQTTRRRRASFQRVICATSSVADEKTPLLTADNLV